MTRSSKATGLVDARGSALVIALVAVTLAGGTAAVLADLARVATERARVDRDGTRAWFLAEAGLAETVAALDAGTTFTAALAAPTVGGSGSSGTYRAELQDDVDETPNDARTDANQRVLLTITALGPPPVRRRLQAVVGRAPDPYLPGAATLAGGVTNLTSDFRLDGRDGAMNTGCAMPGSVRSRAGASLPAGAAVPPLHDPTQIVGADGPSSIVRRRPPDLGPLRTRAGAVHVAPPTVPALVGSVGAPQLTVVDGDAMVAGATSGAGILYAAGTLHVSGTLDFTGVVAAAGGVEVTATGELRVCGALWAAGSTALDARGRGVVHASGDAIAMAARLAPLPARARIVAVRELF